jgi:hypothetical protein
MFPPERGGDGDAPLLLPRRLSSVNGEDSHLHAIPEMRELIINDLA